MVAEAKTSTSKEGDELKCPSYRKGGVGVRREKGCFQQVLLPQPVSWTLLQAGTSMVSGGTGCPGSCEESWWKCYVKQLPVGNPGPEMQCTYLQTEVIYGGGIYWLVQALLNSTSVAPWLLGSLETV